MITLVNKYFKNTVRYRLSLCPGRPMPEEFGNTRPCSTSILKLRL